MAQSSTIPLDQASRHVVEQYYGPARGAILAYLAKRHVPRSERGDILQSALVGFCVRVCKWRGPLSERTAVSMATYAVRDAVRASVETHLDELAMMESIRQTAAVHVTRHNGEPIVLGHRIAS